MSKLEQKLPTMCDSVLQSTFLKQCYDLLHTLQHTRILAKKYGWSTYDVREQYKKSGYMSLVMFELKVMKRSLLCRRPTRKRIPYIFLKVIYWKGYCDYYHKKVYNLERCNICSACNWTWKCQHWSRRRV